MRQLAVDMKNWKFLLERKNTYTHAGFQRVHKSVRGQVKRTKQQIAALSQTIKIVEAKRSRFTNIDDEELESRRAFVSAQKSQIMRYQKAIEAPSVRKKREADKRKVDAMREVDDIELGSTEVSDPIGSQRQKQEMFEEKQDAVLDDMLTVLTRLGVGAKSIGNEVEEQKGLIGSLDDEIGQGTDRMSTVMRKLDKLLGASSGSKFCCLLLMLLMVIILLALALLG